MSWSNNDENAASSWGNEDDDAFANAGFGRRQRGGAFKSVARRSFFGNTSRSWTRSDDAAAAADVVGDGGVDYNKYCIVAERLVALVEPTKHITLVGNMLFEITSSCNFNTKFNRLLVRCLNSPPRLGVNDDSAEPVAELVVWKVGTSTSTWTMPSSSLILSEEYEDLGANMFIQKRALVNLAEFRLSNNPEYFSAVIRVLKKNLNKSPCPPLDTDDEFTITVKGTDADETFVVSAVRLQHVSPVIRAMFRNDTRERAESAMVVKDAEPDEFRAFLEVISSEQPGVLPNPRTVLSLLALADRYQVDLVRDLCEKHLQHCAEMPFVKRMELIDKYGLHNLKSCILSTHPVQLRPLCDKHFDELHGTLSQALFVELMRAIVKSE